VKSWNSIEQEKKNQLAELMADLVSVWCEALACRPPEIFVALWEGQRSPTLSSSVTRRQLCAFLRRAHGIVRANWPETMPDDVQKPQHRPEDN